MHTDRDYLLEILTALTSHDVEFIVCGGVAAVLHGVERLTMDLDISLSLTNTNLMKFLEVMNEEAMVPRAPIPAESILDPEIRTAIVEDKGALVFTFIDTNNPFKQVDFFLTADKSYDALINDVDSLKIDDMTIKVINVNKLIEMKYAIDPMRDKDKRDIMELERLNGANNG